MLSFIKRLLVPSLPIITPEKGFSDGRAAAFKYLSRHPGALSEEILLSEAMQKQAINVYCNAYASGIRSAVFEHRQRITSGEF
jgi:hypothetical protein